jgi:hypothetical protein
LQSLLAVVEGHLADAAVALAMFEGAAADRPRPPSDDEDALGGYEARRAVEHELRAQLPPELSHEQRWAAEQDIRYHAEALLKRRAWDAGHVPTAYTRRLPFIHAHTFVFALDGIIKALEKIAAMPCAPTAAKTACADLKAALPDVVDVRDSAHHVEDRARGKGRGGRKLPNQPVSSHGIEAPGGGVVVMDHLYGSHLAYTVASGHLRDVEVSDSTLAVAQRAVQAMLDAFSWQGPPRTVP